MSGVSNGDLANESTFDSAYMYANGDTGSVGKVSLQNTDPVSGPTVVNTQRLLNELADVDGVAGEGDPNAKVYSSANYVANGDDRKVAIAKLDDQLFLTQSDLESAQADILAHAGRLTTIESDNSTFAGNKTFSGDVSVGGNLTVLGTTTTINSTTVDSVDPNITLNKTGNDLTSEGSGFTVDRTGTKGSLAYENALASKFKIGDLASEAEVATVSHAQTFTNKTLTSPILTTPSTDIISATEQGSTPATPASGVRKLYPKSDGFYQLDSTGLETKVGSGSGGGGVVNLITNGSADDAITSIFTPYADAAGTRPIDGTGGSPTVTTSISAVSPLTGTKSYLLIKPASNTQGEGWAVSTIPLDLSYRAKALKISVDYIVNSGTFVAGSSTTDSDIIWSCYDITNSKIVEPSNIKMFASSASISDKFEATVQFDYNCTSFRLIAHCATTSALAYEIKVDNVTVSPSVYVYGTPITDWQNYTPTFVGLGTVVNPIFRWRRVAGSVEIQGAWTNGTVSGVQASVSLPAGLVGTSPYYFVAGDYGAQGTTTGSEVVFHYINNVLVFGMANWQVLATGTQLANAGICSLNASVPIQGWGASVQMSDSGGDGRVVAATARRITSAFSVGTAATKVQWNSSAKDTHGALDITTDYRYVAPVAGRYQFSGALSFGAAASFTQFYILLYKNGAAVKTQTGIGSATLTSGSPFSFDEDANVGDYFEIYVQTTGAATTVLSAASIIGGSTWDIKRIAGPQAIAANESVNAVYTTAAGQSIPNATDTIIDFGTAEINSHGNVTTGAAWKFTASISGVYEVSAFVQLNSGGGWNVSEEAVVAIFKNGTGSATIGLYAQTVVNSVAVSIPCSPRQVRLLAGEYIDVRINQNSGAALSLVSSGLRNWVSIKKVGN